MSFSLLVAAGLVILPFPGGGMIRNQVVKRAVSMWMVVAGTVRMADAEMAKIGGEAGRDGLDAGAADPGLHDAEVEMDKDVKEPVPELAERAGDGPPPIDLLIMPGGEIKGEGGKLLADDKAVLAYLRDKKNGFGANGEPRLKLKVAEEVAFVHVRRAIGLAAKEGIEEVVFVVSQRQQPGNAPEDAAPGPPAERSHLLERFLEARRGDAQEQLPEVDPEDAPPMVKPFFIKVDDKGRVFANTGAAQELLDDDAEDARLPLLDQRIKIYAAAARLGDAEPAVQIYVEPGARQGRVMDVIDVLRRHEINALTFTDLVDAE